MRGRAHHAPRRQASPGTLPRPPDFRRAGTRFPHVSADVLPPCFSVRKEAESPTLSALPGPSRTARFFRPIRKTTVPSPLIPKNTGPFFSHADGRSFRPALEQRQARVFPHSPPSARRAHGTANARGILYAPDGHAAEVVSPAARPGISTEKEVLCPPSTAPL